MKLNYIRFFLSFIFFVSSILINAQNKNEVNYQKYIDSARAIINSNPKVSKIYLDSIPEPLEESLKGKLAYYYQLRGNINSRLHDQGKLYHNYLLAIKYAEKEKNYNVAGKSNLELFTNTYDVKKDTSAFKYLRQAKHFYTLAENTGQLLEISQMYAYAKLVDDDFSESNKLILPNLARYKAFKEDGYYYMFALFMLTSNYLHSDEWLNAQKYFREFEATEKDTTISLALIKSYKSSLLNCMAESQLKLKQADSALYYLGKSGELKSVMNVDNVKVHYQFHVDAYTLKGDSKSSNAYLDSLNIFQRELLEKNIEASYQINEDLIDSENQLSIETKKKKLNRTFIGVLIVLLLALVIFVSKRFSKIKQKINGFLKEKDEYSYLQTNHDKLKVKVRGLEDYILDVKKEIKKISSINDVSIQREMIKELYKELNLNSSTILDKSKSHLELVNELNIEFFEKINKEYPDLDDTEVIICYYLLIGFKNKEIAVFLNKSLRSIENKRFRAGKKLNIKEKNLSLLDFLHSYSPNNDYSI